MKKISPLPLLKNLHVTLLLALASSVSFAGGASSGLITVPLVLPQSGLFMFMAGALTQSQPSCVKVVSQPWVLDIKTDGGKAAYSMLLTAYAQGKTVTVMGNGTCDLWGDRETVIYTLIN